jgi:peptidoglycan hydrolase-like protein with peptidoglycan-binding domain
MTVIPFNRGQQPRPLGSLVNLDHPISKGATGDDVRDLQRQLYAWGFDTGAFDGIYGAKTTAAVAALQKILRLPQDGIFGSNTLAAISADLAQPRSMLNDRESQYINRPPPPPAGVTPQVPAQLSPSAIVPASATATEAVTADTPKSGGYWGVPLGVWFLITGVAVLGLFLVVKSGDGGLGGESTEDFFEHDELLGVPQPKKRARRRKEADEDETPDDIEDGGDGDGEDGEDTEGEGEE